MIKCDLRKLSFVENFHEKKRFVHFILTSFDTLKQNCMIKTVETFNFLHLINISVTISLTFLLLIISAIISSKTINTLLLISSNTINSF